ncbi:MAG TPA: T9SS type A sorting domain-containing protein [Dyadobacter sp.]|jgi:hypothetical protein|nr:T9SS type A sorting domain-containing protein [Dyadobacter sp.]
MKTLVNIFLLAALLSTSAIRVKAQAIDMLLQSPLLNPSPTSYPGTLSLSFQVVAEILDQPLSSDDMGISMAVINISLSNVQGSAAILPTGPGADLFNWIYQPAVNGYRGTSKDVLLPADKPLLISLSNLPVIGPTLIQNTGFVANLVPPGDLLASESNDDAVTSFTNAPLPVTLVSFSAKKEGSIAQLNWATTEETNSDYFEIQHSVSGKNWANVGQVTSNGESKTLRNYTFSHANPVNGENLYRLKMVDKDATFAYSSIQSVKFDGIATADVSLYPNPVVDKVFIKDYSGVTGVSIFDVNGRAVYQGASPVQGEISVQNLRSGIYIVRVNRANGLASSHKIVVSK